MPSIRESTAEATPPERPSTAQTSRSSRQLNKKPSWCGAFPRVGKATTSTATTNETAVGGTLRSKASADFSRYDVGRGSETASLRSTAENTSAAPAQATAVTKKTTEPATGKHQSPSTPAAIKSSPEVASNPTKRGAKPTKSKQETPPPPPPPPQPATTRPRGNVGRTRHDDNNDDDNDTLSIRSPSVAHNGNYLAQTLLCRQTVKIRRTVVSVFT
jgi:hypothetical protein